MPLTDIRPILVRACLAGLLLLPLGMAAAELPADFDDGAIHRVEYPTWFKDSFLNLQDDAMEAAEAGKRGLFLFFSTQGCSYCHLFLTESLGDPAIAARLREHFDTLGLEIFSDAELTDFDGEDTRVKAFALAQGVQFAPSLLFFDSDGRKLLGLTGYYGPERFSRVLDYLIDGDPEQISLREFLAAGDPDAARWALPTDPLFADQPYALDRSRVPAEHPLLVIFEGADCPRCPRFHAEVLGDAGSSKATSACAVSVGVICGWRNRYRVPPYTG
jgi:thioredoxin-related protein